VAAKVTRNRLVSLNKMKKACSRCKNKGQKVMQMKNAVFDPNEITTPEQTKLAKQVAKQVKVRSDIYAISLDTQF